MQTALIHYWLTNMRGGESVLLELCKLFPQADIFTHACLADNIDPEFSTHQIRESFIAQLPGGRRHCQKYLPLMFKALQKFDLSNYDLIISSESGPAKAVNKRSGAAHICYCHTPMRYLYDMYDEYYQHAPLPGKAAMKLFTPALRKLDRASADKVDHFIANSRFVAQRIQRVWQREAVVIHPPVDTAYFAQASNTGTGDYYLFAGELTAYKHPELALEACKHMNRKLIVAGGGNLEQKLRKRYSCDNITFTGRCSRERLRSLYAGARALIFPNIEDFGIVPLEAQSTGTPVIALQGGGALETVQNNVTGIYFPAMQASSLCAAIEELESRTFYAGIIRRHAAAFDRTVFRDKISNFLQQVL
ncbi:MAG: glycosyltransferase family 4 protein [Lentisphaerae bacterium]|nr:glycosyltransferase family 4 protein [Lentisphaerota bacterium]